MITETETQIIIALEYPDHFRQIAIAKHSGEFSVTNRKGRKVGVTQEENNLAGDAFDIFNDYKSEEPEFKELCKEGMTDKLNQIINRITNK